MKNRGVIFGILFISLIGFISATPYILFVNPTPADGTQDTGSSLTINSTITGVSNLLKFVFNWQGTNYSLYDEDLILMLNLNNNSNLGENDGLVYDSSRGGHNGTVLGGAEYITSGKYAGAYNFTGGQGINISAHEDFNVDEFTISMWVEKGEELKFREISAGGSSTCGILYNGSTLCWGINDYGQLGDGTTTQRFYPVHISGNFSFKQTSLYASTCGLLYNGSALCWGKNNYGQLGIGNTTQMYTPTYVIGGYNFSFIDAGSYNFCALLQNGSAMCWGRNAYGELGIGNTTTMYTPTYVVGGHNFKLISNADGEIVCGLLHNGSALCWGDNAYGQLGLGEGNTTQMYTPTYVVGGHNFSKIASFGYIGACGLLHNGSALCWGRNNYGQLGDGSWENKYSPTSVYGNYNFSNIFSERVHTCGILTNGSTVCWGYNNAWQVGDGTTINTNIPKIIIEDPLFDFISIGHSHTCGLKNNYSYCWGNNRKSQLGDGIYSGSTIPIYFGVEGNFIKAYSGGTHICGLLNNGSLFCSGENTNGELGDGTNISKIFPVFVKGNFKKISLGDEFSCGILHNGSAMCWGRNENGELGDGTGVDKYTPSQVFGGYNFSSIDAGYLHNCGLLQNGSVLCWGGNTYGQLGLGGENTTQMNTPKFVSGGYTFYTISIGIYSSCGLLQNGSALCWGKNNYGQLGLGGTNTTTMYSPTYVLGGYNFSFIESGYNHNCGLLYNGSALCWGYNDYGGVGDNSTSTKYNPTPVYGNYSFSSLGLGSGHTCGILHNGTLLCWGTNSNGQLGDGTLNYKSIPESVNGNYNFSDINCWRMNSCGVLQDESMMCWGNSNSGQLGNGIVNSHKPVLTTTGRIFGKNTNTYAINYLVNGSARIYIAGNYFDVNLEEGWNHLSLTLGSGDLKLYLNGESVYESTRTLRVSNYLKEMIIGEDANGAVDEILMWNRTLTASEINQVYLSSLKQKNHTAWEFYSTQTLSSVGTYSYSLFALDGTGSFSVLRRIIKYITTSSDDDESVGGSPSITVKESKLQEGQVRQLRAGTKVKLEFSGQGSKIIEIVSVNDNSVEVEIEGIEVEIINGTTEKIDVNSDGFYDLEVTVEDISSSGSARLKFKEIYEAVESDIEEGVEKEVKEDGEDVIDEKGISYWYYVLGGFVVLFVVLYFLFVRKK